jgi:non-homologous end joining protein Ku
MRYPNEITDPSHFPELAQMTQIVDKITTDLDLRVYHDGYRERIEAMIRSKLKGEAVQVKERKPRSRRPRA